MTVLYRYRVYCNDEATFVFTWAESEPTTCPNNNGHTINTAQTVVVDTQTTLGSTNSSGDLMVNAGEKNLFGELNINSITSILQNYFIYSSFNSQLVQHFESSGGTYSATTKGSELSVNIPNTIYAYSVVRCSKVIKYKPGISNIVKFNMVFDTPVANSLQFGGIGNANSDLYFCYSGTDFGTRLSTNGLSEIRTLTITNSETSNSKTGTITLDDVEFTVDLDNANNAENSIHFTVAQIAYGTTFTGWNAEAIGDKIVFQARRVGAKTGAFSFSSNGNAAGSFAQTTVGSALETTFVSSANWNGSSNMIQNLDPLKRNMYAIEYSWYGSGNILFKIYNPDTSKYETVHTLKFANNTTQPSLSAPNMFIQQGLASLGSTTPMSIIISGAYAGYQGHSTDFSSLHTIFNTVSIPKKTEKVIVAIKNKNVYNGYSNQSEICLQNMKFTTNGSKNVIIKIYKNPSQLSNFNTDDYRNFSEVSSNSLAIVDYTSQTFSGAQLIDSIFLAKNDDLYISLDKPIELFQAETVIITAESENISEINFCIKLQDNF